MDGVKEAQCARCMHCEVCSLKNLFLAAQKEVDKTIVPLDSEDGKGRMIKIHDIPFIEPVELKCKHYMKRGDLLKR